MNFEYSEKVCALRARVQDFMERYIVPANPDWHREAGQNRFPLQIVQERKDMAKDEGLWNLFLPSLGEDEPGQRLTNVEYAPLAEIMGRIPWAAEVFNCNAPDTGNMELLKLCATPQQYRQWLHPLLEGDIRSAFAMSEPDVASSDATNMQTSIRRDGSEYVINGRKWFITGAMHPNCKMIIVMGVSDERIDTPAHRRHSMVIVPRDTPGLQMVRNIPIMQHVASEGHCELLFRNVRVPMSNLLGEEGGGFLLAQTRLGPGRIHHCMRTIGQCELALELMCERALERKTFGRFLSDYANIQDWIAESRLEIDQARLLVLHAASVIDRLGNQAARVDVSAIKVVAARLQTRVVDRAMQVFGANGPDARHATGLPVDMGARYALSGWAGRSASARGCAKRDGKSKGHSGCYSGLLHDAARKPVSSAPLCKDAYSKWKTASGRNASFSVSSDAIGKYGINKNVDVVTGSLLRNCICAATVCFPKNNRFYVVINDYTAPYPAEAVAGMPAIGC